MALLQQREIIMKLQEEAEARGEHFDIQEYFAQLAEQSEEDDDFGQQENKSDNKLNKSFWNKKTSKIELLLLYIYDYLLNIYIYWINYVYLFNSLKKNLLNGN